MVRQTTLENHDEQARGPQVDVDVPYYDLFDRGSYFTACIVLTLPAGTAPPLFDLPAPVAGTLVRCGVCAFSPTLAPPHRTSFDCASSQWRRPIVGDPRAAAHRLDAFALDVKRRVEVAGGVSGADADERVRGGPEMRDTERCCRAWWWGYVRVLVGTAGGAGRRIYGPQAYSGTRCMRPVSMRMRQRQHRQHPHRPRQHRQHDRHRPHRGPAPRDANRGTDAPAAYAFTSTHVPSFGEGGGKDGAHSSVFCESAFRLSYINPASRRAQGMTYNPHAWTNTGGAGVAFLLLLLLCRRRRLHHYGRLLHVHRRDAGIRVCPAAEHGRTVQHPPQYHVGVGGGLPAIGSGQGGAQELYFYFSALASSTASSSASASSAHSQEHASSNLPK
ncbi:hypothetical protein B0H11DRAFT_2241708 [Mycena galericulata]|nr:hypothetical protein B0H11DRAFT_2241708 [Mycena galericulata]